MRVAILAAAAAMSLAQPETRERIAEAEERAKARMKGKPEPIVGVDPAGDAEPRRTLTPDDNAALAAAQAKRARRALKRSRKA